MKSREEIIKEIRESSNGSWDDMITEGFEAGIKYAQQSQPSGMRWVDDVNKIRGQAKAFGDKYSGSISEQAAAEVGFNAAINQVINILSESSHAGAAEGASEGMAEALRKDIFRLDELRRFHIEPYNLGEMGEVSKIISRLSKLASLSTGVEDNQTKKQ